MKSRISVRRGLAVIAVVALGAGISPLLSSSTASATPRKAGRYIVKAKSDADMVELKNELAAAGATINEDLSQVGSLSVDLDASAATKLSISSHVASMGKTQMRRLVDPEGVKTFSAKRTRTNLGLGAAKPAAPADPASSLTGLMWNLDRIQAGKANAISAGSNDVVVAVADTGLDYTHSELKGQIIGQADFSQTSSAPYCATLGGTDEQYAAYYGVPELGTTDWNGHGSWIGGNIAAALDGVGINGIAPHVKLFDLKIAQNCGSTGDDAILYAFLYAADHGIDVVSISFGGFSDRTDPDQDAIYNLYTDVVAYARSKGTLIVAAAGNEHVRVGAGGQVLSHGSLTVPGDAVADLYGQYETPGGIPGVVAVSATNNVTEAASATCPAGTTGSSATCKPKSDTHQPIKPGSKDQLTYYSNYGPRIDIAAPGGARKFNVPNADRGGSPGFPVTTADGTKAYEEFSITSNWALEIPCYTNVGVGYADECYTSIQGTSMATPHVSAVAGLIASARKDFRHHPQEILDALRDGARQAKNYTPGLSATDFSNGDRNGLACSTGYCHLGGTAIEDDEAYGAGIVDAYRSLTKK